jgi:hypothetical protein
MSPFDDHKNKIDWKAIRDVKSWSKGDIVFVTIFVTLWLVLILKWLYG